MGGKRTLTARGSAKGVLHVSLPDSIRKALAPVIDEGLQMAKRGTRNDEERELIAKILKTVAPTLKAGEIDAGMLLRGPSRNGHFTIAAGLKIQEGNAVNELLKDLVLKDLVDKIPPEVKDLVRLDAESADDVKIHRIDAQKLDPKFQDVFGDNPIYLAIRTDAAYLALGEEGLNVIKAALRSEPATAPTFRVEVGLVSILKLAAAINRDDAKVNIEKAIKSLDYTEGSDLYRVSVEGGDALRVSYLAKTEAIKSIISFFTEVVRYAKPTGIRKIEKKIKKPDDR